MFHSAPYHITVKTWIFINQDAFLVGIQMKQHHGITRSPLFIVAATIQLTPMIVNYALHSSNC